jgi:hypothetical protein
MEEAKDVASLEIEDAAELGTAVIDETVLPSSEVMELMTLACPWKEC